MHINCVEVRSSLSHGNTDEGMRPRTCGGGKESCDEFLLLLELVEDLGVLEQHIFVKDGSHLAVLHLAYHAGAGVRVLECEYSSGWWNLELVWMGSRSSGAKSLG